MSLLQPSPSSHFSSYCRQKHASVFPPTASSHSFFSSKILSGKCPIHFPYRPSPPPLHLSRGPSSVFISISYLDRPPSRFLLPFSICPSVPPLEADGGGSGIRNNNNNNCGNGWGWWSWWGWPWEDCSDHNNGETRSHLYVLPILFLFGILRRCSTDDRNLILFADWAISVVVILLSMTFVMAQSLLPPLSLAETLSGKSGASHFICEVAGGRRTMLFLDPGQDVFVVDQERKGHLGDIGSGKSPSCYKLELSWNFCRDIFSRLMLPEGFPNSVSNDYLEYSLWRGVQGIASQISGVLSTQALLYAVGLGKGAIPTAAAVNWVLKDGIGYLSKIALSRFGRHFDVNPKGWRLCADLLENAAYGLEIITPAFPHLFVLIGVAAVAGRSAAALIQASTRSCFYAGFAVQRNFAEVIAKGEAQGMVSKFLGIMLGIALGNYIGSSTMLALASFGVVTGIHMYCNFKSYQSIKIRTLNPYRACLVFSQYLLSGQIPTMVEVNDEEPIFPGLHGINSDSSSAKSQILSAKAKSAAAEICSRLKLGTRLSELVSNEKDASALFDLFMDEGYLLIEHQGRFCIILKEGSSPDDMLKSIFHVNYLYWLEENIGMMSSSIEDDCMLGGRLQISLDYVQREFNHVKLDGTKSGWVTDGLVARPLPNRICVKKQG